MNELRLIRHAVLLGQFGNFARAAEALKLSQPSLSRAIATLERALGVRLFDRTSKGVVPTAYGRLLLERGPALLRSEAALRRELQLLAGLDLGTLSIGAGPIPGETSVGTAIARISRAHPRLAIQCLSADPDHVVQDVLAARVDVGVARVTGLQADERLVIELLPPLRIYLACRPGHPLTRERKPTWARAMDFPMATSILRGAHAAAVARRDGTLVADEPGAPELVPQIQVNSPTMGRLIARESDALFPGTASMLADDVATGRLVRLSISAPVLRTVHGILYLRERTPAPATQLFIETLREVEAEIRRTETKPDAARVPPANRTRATIRRRA